MTLPLITLDLWLTILLDIVLWFVFHMGFAKIAILIPDRFFDKPIPDVIKQKPIQQFLLKKVFYVHIWKKFSPDGGEYFKEGFSKRHLKEKISHITRNF